jgi:hypothetical protein
VNIATAPAEAPRVPSAPAPAPATAIDRVQAAMRTLLAATDIDAYALTQELDQARKREVAAYVSALADGLDRLNTLVGAAADQAEQFTGSSDEIAEVEHALTSAHSALSDLAAELHPING